MTMALFAARKDLARKEKLGSFIPTLPINGLVGVISRSAVLPVNEGRQTPLPRLSINQSLLRRKRKNLVLYIRMCA
jgi:hypothetical protein